MKGQHFTWGLIVRLQRCPTFWQFPCLLIKLASGGIAIAVVAVRRRVTKIFILKINWYVELIVACIMKSKVTLFCSRHDWIFIANRSSYNQLSIAPAVVPMSHPSLRQRCMEYNYDICCSKLPHDKLQAITDRDRDRLNRSTQRVWKATLSWKSNGPYYGGIGIISVPFEISTLPVLLLLSYILGVWRIIP